MSNDVELLQQMTSVLELRQWLRDKRTYAMGSANEVGMSRETLQELDNTLGRLMDGGVVTPQPEHVDWQSLMSEPAANQPSRMTAEALRPAMAVADPTPQATVNSVDDQAGEPDLDVADDALEPTSAVDDADTEDEGKDEPVVVSDTPAQLTKIEDDRADKTSLEFRSTTESVSDDHDTADHADDPVVPEPTSTPEETVDDGENPFDDGLPDFGDIGLGESSDDEATDNANDQTTDGPAQVSQSVNDAISTSSSDQLPEVSSSDAFFDDLLSQNSEQTN